MSDDSAVVMDLNEYEVSSHPKPGEVVAIRNEDSGGTHQVEIAKREIAMNDRCRSQLGDLVESL